MHRLACRRYSSECLSLGSLLFGLLIDARFTVKRNWNNDLRRRELKRFIQQICSKIKAHGMDQMLLHADQLQQTRWNKQVKAEIALILRDRILDQMKVVREMERIIWRTD